MMNIPAHTSQPYFIAIDLGTTHIKAAIIDARGQHLTSTWRSSTLYRPHPLWCEQDLNEVWAKILECVGEVVRLADLPPRAYLAIALTGQGDGTRLIAEDGTPVRPAIIWQDNRAAGIVADWGNVGRAQAVAAYTRSALCGSHQTAQLAWLQQHEPEALARTWKIFFAKDWLFFRLTGLVGTEQSDAGHTYLEVAQRRWEPRILEILGLEHLADRLPPLLDATVNTGRLPKALSDMLGLPTGLPVIASPLDVVCEVLGVGGFAAGTACSVFGTAGIHQVVVDTLPETPPEAGYTTCIPGKPLWTRFIPTMLAMPNIDYWAGILYPDLEKPAGGYAGWQPIEARLHRIPAGAQGVLYLPFLSPSGERAPRMNPQARAQFSGLSLAHEREHLLRAVYEGIALAAADSFAHLPTARGGVRLTGGGARSGLLAQILADVLARPVFAYDSPDGALRGAIVHACVALDLYSSYEEAFRAIESPYRVYEPDAVNAAIYAELRGRYQELVYGADRVPTVNNNGAPGQLAEP